MKWQDIRKPTVWRLPGLPTQQETGGAPTESGTTKVFRKIDIGPPARQFHLLVVSGQDRGRDFLLAPATLKIGRKEDCFIRLSDTKVSREHAALLYRRRDERFLLEDSQSTNGTFLNERKIRREILRSGDIIKIGETTMQFVMVEPPVKG